MVIYGSHPGATYTSLGWTDSHKQTSIQASNILLGMVLTLLPHSRLKMTKIKQSFIRTEHDSTATLNRVPQTVSNIIVNARNTSNDSVRLNSNEDSIDALVHDSLHLPIPRLPVANRSKKVTSHRRLVIARPCITKLVQNWVGIWRTNSMATSLCKRQVLYLALT